MPPGHITTFDCGGTANPGKDERSLMGGLGEGVGGGGGGGVGWGRGGSVCWGRAGSVCWGIGSSSSSSISRVSFEDSPRFSSL